MMLKFRQLLPMAMAVTLLASGAWADARDGEKRRDRASREYRDDDRRARDGYYEGAYGRDPWDDNDYWRDERHRRGDKEWSKAQKELEKERRKAWKEAEKDRREAERESAKDRREAQREWEKERREATREARKHRRDRGERYPY